MFRWKLHRSIERLSSWRVAPELDRSLLIPYDLISAEQRRFRRTWNDDEQSRIYEEEFLIEKIKFKLVKKIKKSRNAIEEKENKVAKKINKQRKFLSAVDELLTSTNRHLQIAKAEQSATTKIVSTSLLIDVWTDSDKNNFLQRNFNFWLRSKNLSSFVPSTRSLCEATQKTNLSVTLQNVQFFNKVDNLKQYGRSRCYYTR